MPKIYVLDTSALINDPTVYKQFPDSQVIIPISVLGELDSLKKLSTGAGKNARVCIRLLDDLSNQGNIGIGVELENGSIVKVDISYHDFSNPTIAGFGDPSYGDTQILTCAYFYWLESLDKDVTLVSNDINLRVKAKSRGIAAIAHESEKYLTDLYSGTSIIVNEAAGLELQQFGTIDPSAYQFDLHPHECVLFQNEEGDGIAMGRKISDTKLKLIRKLHPWGISSRNKEQSYSIDLMMDRNIDLVTLVGRAGTGKSLMVLATALELVCARKEYSRLIIYRPIQAVGADIGFLPGLMEEKLAPWFQAIMDNLETLLSNKVGADWRKDLEMFQKKGKIEMEAITYIRGRSIPNAIILVDEAQNISKEDMKTILTRAGEGTKIILTGDIEQIDSRDLDSTNNGLTHVIEKFKDSEMAGHITFTQGERSRLATKASEIL